MSIVAIILLIILGIILIIMEFFIIPGVTVAGIGGLLLIGGSIFMAYNSHGTTTGNYILIFSLTSLFILLIVALRSGTWKRIMLNTNLKDSITETPLNKKIKPGDEGITITRLSPMGKVQVNEIMVEAKTLGGMINPNTRVEVIKVLNTNIIVKLKNTNS